MTPTQRGMVEAVVRLTGLGLMLYGAHGVLGWPGVCLLVGWILRFRPWHAR